MNAESSGFVGVVAMVANCRFPGVDNGYWSEEMKTAMMMACRSTTTMALIVAVMVEHACRHRAERKEEGELRP